MQGSSKEVKRDPYRIIWASSYDRGLEWLLQMWPEIKKQVPQTTLHLFYGWQLFDTIHANNPERQAWKKKMNAMFDQEGITHHGRVGHEELEREFKKSGIWSYPTDFTEIFCITAAKAQCFGAIPVVSDYAALKETVKYGVKVPLDEPYKCRTKEWQETYVKALVDQLSSDNDGERESMMDWAKNKFAWSSVAKEWAKEFKKEPMSLDEAKKILLKHDPSLKDQMPI